MKKSSKPVSDHISSRQEQLRSQWVDGHITLERYIDELKLLFSSN